MKPNMKKLVELATKLSKEEEASKEANAISKEAGIAILKEAAADPEALKELGKDLAAVINDTLARSSMVHRNLLKGKVPEGSVSTAVSRFFELSDLDQSADPYLELFRGGAEVFLLTAERLYIAELEGLMPDKNSYVRALKPDDIGLAVSRLTLRGKRPTALWVAMDVLPDLNSGLAFQNLFDPVSKLEVLMTGRVGCALGLDVMTDGFRDSILRVLNPGTVLLAASPTEHGTYQCDGVQIVDPLPQDEGKIGFRLGMTISLRVAESSFDSLYRRRPVLQDLVREQSNLVTKRKIALAEAEGELELLRLRFAAGER